MDPLSLTANIIAVLQLTAEVISYANSVKGANKEQRTLEAEAASVYGILMQLKLRVQDADKEKDWFKTVRILGEPDGALDQYEKALQRLKRSVKDTSTVGGKIVNSLTWKFRKEDVERALRSIERVKLTANLALTNDLLTLNEVINQNVTIVATQVDEMHSRMADDEVRALEEWLSPDDPPTVHAGKAHERRNDTGSWFVNATEDWRIGYSRKQWCLGMPGAGKTILASRLIDHLLDSRPPPDRPVCYFYFNYKERNTQNAEYIYGSFFKQLLHHAARMKPHIKAVQNYYRDTRKRAGRAELRRLLLNELGSCRETWIVIDALDECREDDGTREHLLETLREMPNTVRWLITSRDIPSITDMIDQTSTDESHPLAISANDEDVRKFVEGKIDEETTLQKKVLKKPDLRKEIVDKVSQSVKGMFLMARLHMNSLKAQTTVGDVRRALETLPKGLDDTYDQTVQRMQDGRQWELAKQALMWTVQARRPLHLNEFNHALTIQSGMLEIDEDDIQDGEMFISECAGLVIVDKGSLLVRLVHETAQDYFSRTRSEPILPGAARLVAEACLSYLMLDVMAQNSEPTVAEVAIRIDELPFLRYSARYWGVHVSQTLEDEGIQTQVLGLLADSKRLSSSVDVLSLPDLPDLSSMDIKEFWRPRYQASTRHAYPEATPLCIAAYFGLTSVAEYLLSVDIELLGKKCSQERTPLHYSAGNGHLEMTNVLISKNADVNATDANGITPLHLAADGSSIQVIEALIHANAQINARTQTVDHHSDWSYSTPLHWAASEGRADNVRTLVNAGANVELGNSWHRTPLFLATRQSRIEVMELLIDRGANVNNERDGRGTPICWAAENNHLDAAKLLQRHGAKLCVGSYQGSPLELAITYNQPTMEQYFLTFDRSHGGDEDLVRFSIRAAMNRFGHRDRARHAVFRLLETIPPDQQKSVLNEELAAALTIANFESASFLIDKGAEITQEDNFGRNIMHMSLHHDRFDFFKKGVQAELDHRQKDRQGCEPIHHAASGNCIQGFEWLLEKSADCNVTDNNGWTPLHWAAFKGNHEFIELLLAAGSILDTVDSQARKPLDIASAVRPADTRLLQLLGASEEEAKAIADSAEYSLPEDTWYFHCAHRLPHIRSLHDIERREGCDAQWDWDLSKSLAVFCEFRDGEFGTRRIAQLLSPSNETLYRAGFNRRVEHTQDGQVRASLSRYIERPAFCDCCGYVSRESASNYV